MADFEDIDDDERSLLAELYPELKEKLEASTKKPPKKQKSHPKRRVFAHDVSSDEDVKPMASRQRRSSTNDSEGTSSFHSAKSTVESEERPEDDPVDVSMAALSEMSMDEKSAVSPHDISMPTEKEKISYMEGSFLERRSSRISKDEERDEEETEDEESSDEMQSKDHAGESDEEDSYESSFINDEDDSEDSEDCSSMSIDPSFSPGGMKTPETRRVLPPRSAKSAALRSVAVAQARREVSGDDSGDRKAAKVEDEDSEEHGEESFERYLRKLREERENRKAEESEEEVLSDAEGFVINDSEVDSGDSDEDEEDEEEEEEEEEEWSESDSSEERDKKSRREGKENRQVDRGKTTKKTGDMRKDLLSNLANSFNSPSVRFKPGNKDARDPDRHFVLSLADDYEGGRHADAERFVRRGVKGKKTRAELVERLAEIYNREIFDKKLPADMSITFNARLTKTGGYCKYKAGIARIELSPKVCSTAARIRDTLAHEMCHAAVFLINHALKEKHGPFWKAWAARFSRRFRGLPMPTRCHDYEIDAKFIYECDGCGQKIKRHSKSFDTKAKICGICHGHFVLRESETTKKATPFALFVKDNYGEEKKSGRSHREIMQTLSAKFKQSKEVEVEGEEKPVKRLELDLSVMSIEEGF